MDRRSFLKNSGGWLGGFLINPQMGVIGAIAAGAAAIASSDSDATTDSLERARRTLLRAGEPINSRGEPFGSSISGIATVALPDANKDSRLIAVVSHEHPVQNQIHNVSRRSTGISSIEFERSKSGGWRHVVESSRNKRWDAVTPMPIDGMRLSNVPERPAFRHQAMTSGVMGVSCAASTPWNTVLCGEGNAQAAASTLGLEMNSSEFGWVVEVNPVTAQAVKRFSMGRINPISILTLAMAGKPTIVYLLGRDQERERLFKFISHQSYNAKQLNLNSSAFVIGNLFVADIDSGNWISLSPDLESSESWLALMQEPHRASKVEAQFLNSGGLKWNSKNNAVEFTHQGESGIALASIAESSPAHESRAFSYSSVEQNQDSAISAVLGSGDFLVERASQDSAIFCLV